MSEGVHSLAKAVRIVEAAQKDELSLDEDQQYEAVKMLVKFARRALDLQGAVGSLLLSLADGRSSGRS